MARSQNEYVSRRKNEYVAPRRGGGGGAGKTVAGLMGLGMVSALVGALVVGPNLGKRLRAEPLEKAPEVASVSAPVAAEEPPASAARETPQPEATTAQVTGISTDEEAKTETEPSAGVPGKQETPGTTTEGESAVVQAAERDNPREEDPDTGSLTRTTVRSERRPDPLPATVTPSLRETPSSREDSNLRDRKREDSREERASGRRRTEEAEQPSSDASSERTSRKESRSRSEDSRRERSDEREKEPKAERSKPKLQGDHLYRVRVGRFKSREAAEKFRKEFFDSTGQGADLVAVGDSFRLQVGAYRSKDTADRVADQIRGQNYRADVSEAELAARRAKRDAAESQGSGPE